MKCVRSILVLAAFLIASSATPVFASQTVGMIDSTQKYAWGDRIGWINFAPTDGSNYTGLTITDSTVTGYAWSRDYGWINMNPTNGGVTNTPNGVLDGYAWVSSIGWISFHGVTIDTNGHFKGIAGVANTDTGRISFDCSGCTVVTDWRPASVRNTIPTTGGPGGGGGGNSGQILPGTSGGTTTPQTTTPGLLGILGNGLRNVFPGLFGTNPTTGIAAVGGATGTSTIPGNLLDISLALEKSIVVQGEPLNATVAFTNFGRNTTHAALLFTVIDAHGATLGTATGTTDIQTTQLVRRAFPTDSLAAGKYHLHLLVTYGNKGVQEQFDQGFTVAEPSNLTCGLPWPLSWLYRSVPELYTWFGCVFPWIILVILACAVLYTIYRTWQRSHNKKSSRRV